MRGWKYIANGSSLTIDAASCTRCGACIEVCPHAALRLESGGVSIRDRSLCMECGACARNCPTLAISVTSGVGCAAAIIAGKLRGTAPTCGCDSPGCEASTRGCC